MTPVALSLDYQMDGKYPKMENTGEELDRRRQKLKGNMGLVLDTLIW